jgi:curli biogenesis system outer membrane secretion channel CsgG
MKHARVTVAVWLCLAGMAAAVEPASRGRPRRIKVAVMDFDGTVTDRWWGEGDIGRGMATQVVDRLLDDGTFSVIERSRLDTVLAEQDFAASKRADPAAATLARIGKVMGIRSVVAGSITKFGSEQKKYGAGAAGAALGPI